MTPSPTYECPQKISAQSVQQFGRPYATFIFKNVLFYYIDIFRSGLTLVSSNDAITIKIDKKIVKNHKKIKIKKDYLKKLGCKWTTGKRTQIMR